MKIEKKNKNLDEFLRELDLNNLEKDLMFSDLDDDEEVPGTFTGQSSVNNFTNKILENDSQFVSLQPLQY